jgi:hypothetical protein
MLRIWLPMRYRPIGRSCCSAEHCWVELIVASRESTKLGVIVEQLDAVSSNPANIPAQIEQQPEVCA